MYLGKGYRNIFPENDLRSSNWFDFWSFKGNRQKRLGSYEMSGFPWWNQPPSPLLPLSRMNLLQTVMVLWLLWMNAPHHPCDLAGKESTCNVGDLGSIPRLGRFPGEGKGYPFQYSGLENSMDYRVHVTIESQRDTTERLSLHHKDSLLIFN